MDYSSQRVDVRRRRLLACENVCAIFGQVVEQVLGLEPSETLFGEPQESQVRPDLAKVFSTHHDFFGILLHDDLLLKIRWTIDKCYDSHRSLLG